MGIRGKMVLCRLQLEPTHNKRSLTCTITVTLFKNYLHIQSAAHTNYTHGTKQFAFLSVDVQCAGLYSVGHRRGKKMQQKTKKKQGQLTKFWPKLSFPTYNML